MDAIKNLVGFILAGLAIAFFCGVALAGWILDNEDPAPDERESWV